MTEINSEGSQSYTIPLDSIDLTYLSKYVLTPHAEKRPLWTKERLDRESEYCHVQIVTQDDNEDWYSEETFDTLSCHICNVEVPVLCFKKHNECEKHVTLKTIFQKVLEKVSKQINISDFNNDKNIDKDVYYCVSCSKIIKIENKLRHESSEYHAKSQRVINVVHEFYKIFEDNKGSVGVKEVGNDEILNENRDLTANNFGAVIIQNDSKNNNVNVAFNEEKSDNDEIKTACSINEHTMKPTCTVEHLVPNDKHNEELTSEENYFKDMVKKYNLKVNLPIVDGEFIHVASPSGVKVKISRDHFHSYRSIVEGIRVYCQMCDTQVELGEETKHKVSAKHARKLFLPVNEQFARTLNDDYSHCVICNKVVRTSTQSKHHLYNDNHVKLLNSTKLTICQNNEDLANVINTENNIERTHSEKHTIEDHVNKSEEDKMLKCINSKECITELNLSENDLDVHLNVSGHIARTNDTTSDQKHVLCKLCNVSVPQDQMEYHNAGTPHWTNALKKICTNVADWLQAYFSEDNLKSDSDSSEIQNDTDQNDTLDNVAKHNKTPKNDNVTNQNDTLDNVAKQNKTHKNYNVTNQNDTLNNEAKPNKAFKIDNVTNQNDTLNNNNVAKTSVSNITSNEIDTSSSLRYVDSKNDNVTNQNDTLNNEAKPNKTPKNDNVTNQNDTLNNNNVAKISVSNITSNEIDTSSSFRYADSTKSKITCKVCDVDIANVVQSITKHEESSNHKKWLRKLLKFHMIRKTATRSFCECCSGVIVTNIWIHITTEEHTALIQLEYPIDSERLKLCVYKSKIRNLHGLMAKELYRMLLVSNKIYKLSNSHFYCTFCELELAENGNEIDHMFSAAHEKWLTNILKSIDLKIIFSHLSPLFNHSLDQCVTEF